MMVLVTGASGFVGNATCVRLVSQGMDVIGTVRHLPNRPLPGLEYRIVGDLDSNSDWFAALTGVGAVIHCAARVHVMRETAADPLQEFRRVNVGWTERLARTAASQGVHRFVYLSSIKVHGEQSIAPFTEQDLPKPQDPSGISK